MLKSKNDRNDFSKVSNIIDDSIASNLYEHMICGLIKNLLFYNINIDINDGVNLEMPTRLSVIPLDDTNKIEQFKKLGYRESIKKFSYDGKESCGFFSTDEKTFKTSIATLLINDKRRINMSFNKINVQSINYSTSSESMAFLYLADFLCDNIRSNIDVTKDDHDIDGLHKWAKEVTGGNEPFLWAYDDIDSTYAQVMDRFYIKGFVDTLEELYEARNFKSNYIEYYKKNWFMLILNNIDSVFELGELDSYVSKLDKMLKCDNVNSNRLGYVFDILWKQVQEYGDKVSSRLIYRVADVGIRVYNHKGDTLETDKFYKICIKHKESVDIQEYLDTVNRIVVIYADKFDFDEALELVKYNLECFDILKKAKKDIAELNDSKSMLSTKLTGRGRALSSVGQYLAFKKDKAAFCYFIKALEEFKGDRGNSNITISYLLHCAIDQNKTEKYVEFAIDYFDGNKDIEKQFEYILKSKDSFMFFVFVKSLNNLYFESISGRLLENLRATDYKTMGFQTSSHPWELIYKNIGLILYKKQENKFASRLMEKAINTIHHPSTTIVVINYNTKIQQYFYEENQEMLRRTIEKFKLFVVKEGQSTYFKDCFSNELSTTFENLQKKFVYMYA